MMKFTIFSSLFIATASGSCIKYSIPEDEWNQFVKSPLPHKYLEPHHLPNTWDWRNPDGSGKSMLTPVLNQHMPKYCGSCWLHGGTSVMNDRLKILRGGRGEDVLLARQVVLNCGESNGAHAGSCSGGSDIGLYNYVREFGIPDETCQEYDATDHECSAYRQCMNCDSSPLGKAGEFNMKEKACYPVERYGKYFVKEWGVINSKIIKDSVSMIHQMKAEIYARGPISCSISSEQLLYGNYKPGEILDVDTPPDGKKWDLDHVVGVVGWGEQDGKKFWQGRNSWGTFWGENGWFKLGLGKNVIGVETVCAWAAMEPEARVSNYGPQEDAKIRMFSSNPWKTNQNTTEDVMIIV